ncbi:hypothetical protein GCM10010371_01140 [Streptomyces subrutilus]|uniref:Uncharacterized protein n=1 Tax=Streptomyces subrutilus TaxID=36818 RepID=A0A918QI38_9ACTN|nr:hypothetical protein GCM10010371_01140 [Streptomyces subrutilus]
MLGQWLERDKVLTGPSLVPIVAPRRPRAGTLLGAAPAGPRPAASGPRPLLAVYEPRDGNLRCLGVRQEIGASRIALAALVALDAAVFETDSIGKLILREVQIAAALGDALAQLLSADDDPFG